MREPEVVDPESQPRFQNAARHAAVLARVFWASAVAVAELLWLLWRRLLPDWQTILVTQGAALLVLMACLQSAWWVARWRARLLRPPPAVALPTAGALSTAGVLPTAGVLLSRILPARLRILIMRRLYLSAAPVAATALLTGLALWLVGRDWSDSAAAPAEFAVPAWTGAVALAAAAFFLLVLERFYAGARQRELPESPWITCALRPAIAVTLLLAGCGLLISEGRQWPLRLAGWIALIPAAIAVELMLRALLSVFAPPAQGEPELLARSLLASLWRWPFRPLQDLQDELNKSFGIDLRQSWAFAFIRRALLPVLGALGILGWLLTGLTEIPLAARGIYERFGRPVAVWQPGFHLGLPWPFGRVHRVENGVVHELTAASASNPGDKWPVEPEPSSAEGPPPASANRLWDVSHVAEKSQVIASTASGDRPSFHIVNMDVRFLYRIGLDDAAALAARYHTADLPGLIRSAAGRILVDYFASRTLEGVLGERRIQLAQDLGARLQADLDRLQAGVEIMATVVESIHPPAAAAYSYQSVQAAQIRAQAILARERGSAAQVLDVARLRAQMATAAATAGARETLAHAEVAERRSAAERQAFAVGGTAFLTEHYLAQLTRGLSSARLVLVDHRLETAGAVVDLRSFSADASLPLTTTPATGVSVDPMDK